MGKNSLIDPNFKLEELNENSISTIPNNLTQNSIEFNYPLKKDSLNDRVIEFDKSTFDYQHSFI